MAAAAFYREGVNLMARNYPFATYREIAAEFEISLQLVYLYLSDETKRFMQQARAKRLDCRSEKVWELFQTNPELTYREIGARLGINPPVVAKDLAKAYYRRMSK